MYKRVSYLEIYSTVFLFILFDVLFQTYVLKTNIPFLFSWVIIISALTLPLRKYVKRDSIKMMFWWPFLYYKKKLK